jgi:hypothetical protein
MKLPALILTSFAIPLLSHADAPLPTFSWDTVPVYEMFARGDRLLNDEEREHIAANTNFLCIEKNHAAATMGGSDHGAREEIKAFRKIAPETTCLFYFNSAYAYPFTSRSKGFRYGAVERQLGDFLLRDPKTGEFYHRGRVHYFDVLETEFREWWSKEVGRYVHETGADGLFVDQMHGFSFLRPKFRKDVREAQAEMMRMAKQAIGKDKILLLNNGAHIPELFEIGDSFMFEHYAAKSLTKEEILKDWELMEKISKAGKSSVWRIGVEVEDEERKLSVGEYQQLAKKRLPFYLAAFLAGAVEYSYFQYGWGWRLDTGPLVTYEEFGRALGKPLGPRARVNPGGWIFKREFEGARIRVDLKSREGSVVWK